MTDRLTLHTNVALVLFNGVEEQFLEILCIAEGRVRFCCESKIEWARCCPPSLYAHIVVSGLKLYTQTVN